MNFHEKQLGQSRPSGTTAASLYSPPSGKTGIVKSIFVANTTAAAAAFRIFVDDDGTTYDQSTALFYDTNINANETVEIDTYIPMDDSNGNLAVRTDTANALTFTAFGAEVTE